MEKSIYYLGHSTVPADYEAADGQLALSLNIISENSHLSPISAPQPILHLQPNESILLLHHAAASTNIILARPTQSGSTDILWLPFDPSSPHNDIPDTSGATFITNLPDVSDAAIMGNTLCLATPSGLFYIIWSDNNYSPLGSQPPLLAIEFAAVERSTSIRQSHSFPLPFDHQEATHLILQPEIGFRVEDQYRTDLSNTVHAVINSQIARHCTSRGYFWQPFFVRYAYRLFDGSNAWASQPILILTTTLLPIVRFRESTFHFGLDPGTGPTLSPVCGLAHRIIDLDLTTLQLWKDIIVGVDIFVSAPILTYDPNCTVSECLPFRLAQQDAPAIADSINSLIYPGAFARPIDYTDPRDNPLIDFIPDVTPDPFPESVDFSYRDITIPADASTSYGDDYRNFVYAHLAPNYNFRKQLLAVNAFYHVHTYLLSEMSSSQTFDWTKIDCATDADTLATRPTLNDSTSSPYNVAPASLFSYNSRLHIANLSVSPPTPANLRLCVPYENDPLIAPTPAYTSYTTSYNGTPLCYNPARPSRPSQLQYYPSHLLPPRYLFIPDLNASVAYLRIGPIVYTLPIGQADFLNGSHYFAGCAPISQIRPALSPSSSDPDLTSYPTSTSAHNAMYVSPVNNPFTFPLVSALSIGSGTILALSSATKALSQGQFGQFPLYVFTSDGIWALELSSDASYTTQHPVSRDVCLSPHAIAQTDTSVIFASSRGILSLSGSAVTPLSQSIDDDSSFLISSLPALPPLISSIFSASLRQSCDLIPLSSFLTDARFIFDYANQHLVLYNTSAPYSYILSLKSGAWATTSSTFLSNVNSWPYALAIDADNNLINLSATSQTPLPSIIITRPLKIDAPDILKTIDSVIQRGSFRKGHVRSILYGSRDLISWHLVWSSTDHCLSGFRGSPYKYFRIVLLSNLSPDESIFGASIQFTPKFTDKLR